MNDFLDNLVARRVTAHVGAAPALASGTPPEFTSIENYFPLTPITDGRVMFSAWPLIDGQLSTTQPLKSTSSSFSAGYGQYLSAVNLRGTGPALGQLASDQRRALEALRKAAKDNGGLCMTARDHAGTPCNYVPGYGAKWVDQTGLGDLTIKVDVWRLDATAPWSEHRNQHGGQRLRASLIYSDFKIILLTPAPLTARTGWYSDDLTTGLHTGSAKNVHFDRQSNFGTTTGFVRAAAFAMVGRMQFQRANNSTARSQELFTPAEPLRMSRSGGTPSSVLRLTPNLVFPKMKVATPRSRLRGMNAETNWDSGNLYTTLKQGFIVAAIPDAPLSPRTRS